MIASLMSRLVGTWELVRWTARVGERTQLPFGGNPAGLLVYTVHGTMSATLMRRDRSPISATTLAGATARERAGAAAGYLSYGGTYTVEGRRVRHHVQVSLLPNWVGRDQVRNIRWVGEDLELASDPETGRSGLEIVNRLLWSRVRP